MERPGSADPNGERVAERTWDCPCHVWHLGSLRRSIVSGEPKCRPSPSVPYANGAWRARDLPETALHATSPRLTPRPSTASLTCVTVWEREVVQGVVNPPHIDGKDGVAGWIPAGASTPRLTSCFAANEAASTQAAGGMAVGERIPALLPSSPSGSNLASRMRMCRTSLRVSSLRRQRRATGLRSAARSVPGTVRPQPRGSRREGVHLASRDLAV